MVFESKNEAILYEPDNQLYWAIRVADEVEQVVRQWIQEIALRSTPIAIVIFGASVGGYATEMIELFGMLVGFGVGSIFLTPSVVYSLFKVYAQSLAINVELIQEVNRDLVIPPGDIVSEERRREELVSYYLWHSSPCSSTKQVVVIILAMIRLIRPQAYRHIRERVAENVSEHLDQTLSRMIGREYEIYRRKKINEGELPD